MRISGHSRDIVLVLGLENDITQSSLIEQRLQKVTSTFALQIDGLDDARKLLRDFKKITPEFTWSTYTHRLFFHWGFNTDPRKGSPALREQIKKATKGNTSQEETLWQLVINMQASRNRKMIRCLQNFGLNRNDASALATILYNVHILGDYIQGAEAPQSALISLILLRQDLTHAVDRLHANREKRTVFAKELKEASGKTTSKSVTAQHMLDVLIIKIPEIINDKPHIKRALCGD